MDGWMDGRMEGEKTRKRDRKDTKSTVSGGWGRADSACIDYTSYI